MQPLLRVADIALLPAADYEAYRRSYCFMTARSIHSRDGQSEELFSKRTSASYGDEAPQNHDLDVLRVNRSLYPLELLYHSVQPQQKSS